MYSRILVPTDGTERSALALEAALGLAKLGGGTVIGLHAGGVPQLHDTGLGIEDPNRAAWRLEREQQARDALAYVTRRATEAGVPSETIMTPGDVPYEAIIEAARDRDCDLIVMAAHGRHGLAARLLGSETQKVLTHSAIPVLVVR